MKRLLAVLLCLIIFSTIPVSASATEGEPVVPPPVVTTPIDIGDCLVELSAASYTYNATERTPKVKVSNSETVFEKDKDFTVEYFDNINAGTARVVVSALSGSQVLSGTVTKYFRIDKKDISSLKKSISQTDFVYSGQANKPTLAFSSSTLSPVLGTDYTLTYKNNVKIGYATVTAKGKGNYNGTYSKTFIIHPGKVKNLKVSELKDTTFKLSWNKVEGNITGYRLYRYNSTTKEYDYAVSTANNYFNVGGRTPATTYTYVVRAYRKVDSKIILGEESVGKKVLMKPKKVTVKPSAFSGQNFVFKWEKVKSNGYQIIYSKYKNMKKGVKTININSGKTLTKKVKLSKSIKYYYKIRAYKLKSDGTKLFGAWSDKKITQFSNVYAQYSTYFNSPSGRTTNIKLACKYIDGTILRPGEVFSFNNTVGQRTPQRGFKLATVYSGQEVKEGYGGGICQVSTTIFNAALYANLSIVERYQHSMQVHYIPNGRDAAVSWGSADFKFRNSTTHDIKISAKVYNDSKIEIKLLTNASAKPKKVSLNVSNSGKQYVLTRTVDGTVNYRTYSYY